MTSTSRPQYHSNYPDWYNYGQLIFDVLYPVSVTELERGALRVNRKITEIYDPLEGMANYFDGIVFTNQSQCSDLILKLANDEFIAPADKLGLEISIKQYLHASMSIADIATIYAQYRVLRLKDEKDAVVIRDDLNAYINAVERASMMEPNYTPPPHEDIQILKALYTDILDLSETIEYYTEDHQFSPLINLFDKQRTKFIRPVESVPERHSNKPKNGVKDLMDLDLNRLSGFDENPTESDSDGSNVDLNKFFDDLGEILIMLDNPNVNSEFLSIANGPMPDVFSNYTVIIIANKKRLKMVRLESMEILRDYEGQFGDEIYADVTVGSETFRQYILPYRDNLQLEVHRQSTDAYGNNVSSIAPTIHKYSAYMINPPHLDFIDQKRGDSDPILNELDRQITTTYQLIDSTLDEMRMTTYLGSYSGTVMSLLENMYGYNFNPKQPVSTLVSASYTGFRGVDIIAPDNSQSYDESNPFLIPTRTRLTKIAALLQKRLGVYSTGIGRYYQNGYWFIYPLYNHERFKMDKHRLVVYNVPENEMQAPERSFKVRNLVTTVFATGETNAVDRRINISADQGTALVYTRASKLIGNMTTRSDNKAIPNLDKTNVSFSVLKTQNGLTNVRHLKQEFTDNPYPEASEMAKGLGVYVQCQWENSKPSYITPGMPVQFYYEKDGVLKSVYGVVLGARVHIATASKQHSDNCFITTTSLVFHLSPDE